MKMVTGNLTPKMAKQLNPAVRSFAIDGIVYTDGDRLQVIAPELGLLPVVVEFESYSTAQLVTMSLGWIRTPLPCRMNNRPDSPNAMLKLSCTRMPATGPGNSIPPYIANTMNLVYFCLCDQRKHTNAITWHDVSIDTGIIRANQRGIDTTGKAYNHPLVPGYEHLQPMPFEELKREHITTDKHGQFKLF